MRFGKTNAQQIDLCTYILDSTFKTMPMVCLIYI